MEDEVVGRVKCDLQTALLDQLGGRERLTLSGGVVELVEAKFQRHRIEFVQQGGCHAADSLAQPTALHQPTDAHTGEHGALDLGNWEME